MPFLCGNQQGNEGRVESGGILRRGYLYAFGAAFDSDDVYRRLFGRRVEIFKRYVSGGARSRVELAVLAWCAYDYFARGRQLDDFILEDLLRAAERQEEIPFVCKLACVKYYAENKSERQEQLELAESFLRELMGRRDSLKTFP